MAESTPLKVKLQCPMPKLDFDVITLGHGSGGKLTHQLLESGVFDLFSNPYLDKQDDGVILPIQGEVVFSTDSFLVSPLFFPGGSIGDLAVNGTVNDIAMSGGVPQYLSLSFIIEEGLSMETFWQVLLDIKEAAEASGVMIVTGDTKVVEKGKGDQLFINTSGLGTKIPNSRLGSECIESGDKIIVSGEIATHGMAIMSVREGLEFDSEIQSDTVALNDVTTSLIADYGEEIHFLTDPTRGGVATVLVEIAQSTNLGIDISQTELPLNDQVASACELLGIDPLYVANEGIFIAIVKKESAESVLDSLQKINKGKNARIIGEVTSDHPKQVLLKSTIGGKRIISMLPGDQLPRIC